MKETEQNLSFAQLCFHWVAAPSLWFVTAIIEGYDSVWLSSRRDKIIGAEKQLTVLKSLEQFVSGWQRQQKEAKKNKIWEGLRAMNELVTFIDDDPSYLTERNTEKGKKPREMPEPSE